jgi:tetratricopeptide (TPR) repeat protein
LSTETAEHSKARIAHDALARGSTLLQRGEEERGRSSDAAKALFERALEAFREAREADGSDAASVGMGEALLSLERNEGARSSFFAAIAKNPDNVQAHWGLVKVLGPLEALESLRRVNELSPRFEVAWIERAKALLERNQAADASAVLRQAIEANPGSAGLLSFYAEQLEKVGDYREALAHYKRAIEVARPDETFLRLGAQLSSGAIEIDLNHPHEAMKHLRLVVDAASDPGASTQNIVPLVAAAHYCIAVAYIKLKRYDEAVDQLEVARRTHGYVALLSLQLQIAALRALGRYATAWGLLDELQNEVDRSREAGLAPTESEFVRAYGEMLRLRGGPDDRDSAVRLYRDALHPEYDDTGVPDETGLRVELIRTYLEQREAALEPFDDVGEILVDGRRLAAERFGDARAEIVRAEEGCERELEKNRSWKNLLNRGALRVIAGREHEAQADLTEALGLAEAAGVASVELETVHACLAVAYARAGQHARAARAFEAALRIDPDDLGYQIGRAEAYLRLGHLDIAESAYRDALVIAPDNVEALIGRAETLTAQADAGDSARYRVAGRGFAEAIRVAEETSPDRPLRDRKGSTAPGRRKLATLHYGRGYALARQFETDSASGRLGTRDTTPLVDSRSSFEEARRLDPGHPLAADAAIRIQQELQRQSRKVLDARSRVLPAVCLVVLVLVNLFFFVPPLRHTLGHDFQRQLRPETYALLVFGLVALLVAIVSLPELLKLNVGGISLEKATIDQTAVPVRLEIDRGSPLSGLVAQTFPTLRFDADRPGPQPTDGEAAGVNQGPTPTTNVLEGRRRLGDNGEQPVD